MQVLRLHLECSESEFLGRGGTLCCNKPTRDPDAYIHARISVCTSMTLGWNVVLCVLCWASSSCSLYSIFIFCMLF